MDYEDLLDQVRFTLLRNTDVYSDFSVSPPGRKYRMKGDLEKDVIKSMKDVLPKKQEIGKAILENRSQIIKNLTTLENDWIEKISNFEDAIDEAWDRVITGAKEDVAMLKHDEEAEELVNQGIDPDDAEEKVEEIDPSDIEDEEIWEYYTHEDLWQYWDQEWHHNIQGRKNRKGEEMWPIAKYINKSDFDFHQFRQYEFHIPSVFIGIIRELEQEVEHAIYEFKEAIQEIYNTLNEKKSEIFEAIFENKSFKL